MEMSSFSFVHAADLHLDTPFSGLRSVHPALQKRMQQATTAAFDRVVALCLREKVDFLLLAGDVFDAADRSLRAQIHLKNGLEALSRAGISTFVAHGNHDHLGGWRASLSWPENVHFFPAGEVTSIPVVKDGHHLASVYGTSYPQREVTKPLTPLFPRPTGAPYTIALLHCNLGDNPDHGNYSPIRLQDLESLGYDYWALGHIHSRAIVREKLPVIVYPGNTQGLNPKETGPRGCYLVKVQNGTTSLTFVPTDDVRWHCLSLSIDGLSTMQELLELLTDLEKRLSPPPGGGNMVRVTLTGRGRLHWELSRPGVIADILEEIQSENSSVYSDFGSGFTWVDAIDLNTCPEVDRNSLLHGETFLADFLSYLDLARSDETVGEDVKTALAQLFDHRQARKWLSEPGLDEVKRILDEAESLGLGLLLEGENDG